MAGGASAAADGGGGGAGEDEGEVRGSGELGWEHRAVRAMRGAEGKAFVFSNWCGTARLFSSDAVSVWRRYATAQG